MSKTRLFTDLDGGEIVLRDVGSDSEGRPLYAIDGYVHYQDLIALGARLLQEHAAALGHPSIPTGEICRCADLRHDYQETPQD